MTMLQRLRSLATGRTAVIGVPYLWLLAFFLLPFLIVARISVSEMENVAVQGPDGRSRTACCS